MRWFRKLPRKLVVAVILAIFLSGGWWWWRWSSRYNGPASSFSDGLFDHGPTNHERLKSEVTSRLLTRFPLGSSEAALETELAREGFRPKVPWPNYSYYTRHIGWLATETTMVRWKADDNHNLVALEGLVLRDANVP